MHTTTQSTHSTVPSPPPPAKLSGMSAHLPTALAVFGRRRTWGELLYAVLGLPLGVAGFTFTVTTLSVSAGLVITFVGLPLLAVTGLASRYFGSRIRSAGEPADRHAMSRRRAPFRTEPGVFGCIGLPARRHRLARAALPAC